MSANVINDIEEQKKKYIELFPDDMTISDMSNKLDSMEQNDETALYRQEFCNELVYAITAGYIEYGTNADFKNDELVQIFIRNVHRLPKDKCFYQMLSSFYQGKNKECMTFFDLFCDHIKEEIESGQEPYNEALLVDGLLEPMKGAFPGFWSHAQKKMEKLCTTDGTQELCGLMDQIYSRSSDDEAVDILIAYIQKYPNIIVTKEYLACIYFNLKMYQNSIACFESVDEEDTMLFAMCPGTREALLGDAYGKIRNYKLEEEHYRKAVEYNPKMLYVTNNIGYSLYKQKRYIEALEIFKSCVDEKKDLPYAANNYLRTLIALGRNRDAKEFIKRKEFKLVKSLVDKAKNLPDTNQRITKKDIEAEAKLKEFEPEDVEETQVDTTALKVKGSQFSTEKILEDELTQRIENNMPVFGMNLKMYKRKGEYGRQYIIPVGRLDLFCEDESGNLYVIELKKDSGYDDAYKQTSDYLDWFAQSPKFKDRKVYGIICLNNPTADLISKVKSDDRMRLFEYQVSYTEIK